MNKEPPCEFCEQPLSEHSVAGACPKKLPIEIDVRLLTPWETIGLAILGAVNQLVHQTTQAMLARVAIRSIGKRGKNE